MAKAKKKKAARKFKRNDLAKMEIAAGKDDLRRARKVAKFVK